MSPFNFLSCLSSLPAYWVHSFLFSKMHMCRSCVWGCRRRSEEDMVAPGTRVIDGWDSPDVGARIQTWVLWKIRKCS